VGGDPATQFTKAWEYFLVGDYASASKGFDSVIALLDQAHDSESTPNPLRLKAMYGLAQTWDLGRREEDPNKAASLYHRIIQLSPTSEQAAWSMLALARMQHVVPVGEEPNLPAVRQAYQDVIDHFPNHPAAEEAFIYQQSTLVSAIDPDQAKQALGPLTAFVQSHPTSKFVSPAWGLIAACQKTLGDPQASLVADIHGFETREVDPTNPYVDNANPYWHLATFAEFSAGDFATARKYYGKLIAEYPADQRVFPAQQALERMDKMEKSIADELGAASSRGTAHGS
jgi:tetratricopeptide (TPR) repeat protein